MATKLRAYKNQLATELGSLSNALLNTDICQDIGPISAARNMLYSDKKIIDPCTKKASTELWGYEINQLKLRFKEKPKHLMPSDVEDLALLLDVKCYGVVPEKKRICDPLATMTVSIRLSGQRFRTNGDVVEALSAIHLDKHTEEEKAGELHPVYHFQFGGKNIRELKKHNDSFGQLMILDIPRISHYPMDGVLAVDFVLSNYFYETWRSIIENGEYINLVRKKQKMIMMPYFHALANHWKFDTNVIDWKSDNLIPQLQ